MAMTEAKKRLNVHIRWMLLRDMPEALRIEQESFDHPWSSEEFDDTIRQKSVVGMVAEHNDRVVGFFVYYLGREVIDVIDLAVSAEYRGRGVGTAMIDKLKGKLRDKRKKLVAFVSERNLGAQLFFRSQGFIATKICPEFYEIVDAIHFVFRKGW